MTQHSHTTDFWLFSDEIQRVIEKKCILFHIRGHSEFGMDAYTGSLARTVPTDQRTLSPAAEDEIVVRTVNRGRPKQISIHPRFLMPWTPLVGSEVVITQGKWLGTLGLVKGRQGDDWIVGNESGDFVFEEKDMAPVKPHK
jgi:hypothetical protein